MSNNIAYDIKMNLSHFKLTNNTLEIPKLIGKNQYTYILLYMTSCLGCKSLIPIFNQLPNHNINISKINISTEDGKEILQMLQKKFKIEYVPYILLFSNGSYVSTINTTTESLTLDYFKNYIINKPGVNNKQINKVCIIKGYNEDIDY